MRSITISNNKTIEVDSTNHKICINGVEFEFPKKVSHFKVATIDGKIFINGYEFTGRGWKRTLRSLWHYYF